jgi:hypothetical protein
MSAEEAGRTVDRMLRAGTTQYPPAVRNALGTCTLCEFTRAINKTKVSGEARKLFEKECRRQRRNFKNNRYQLLSRIRHRQAPAVQQTTPLVALVERAAEKRTFVRTGQNHLIGRQRSILVISITPTSPPVGAV